MLFKAISEAVVSLLKELHLYGLPSDTYLAGGTAVAFYLNHRISVDMGTFRLQSLLTGLVKFV